MSDQREGEWQIDVVTGDIYRIGENGIEYMTLAEAEAKLNEHERLREFGGYNSADLLRVVANDYERTKPEAAEIVRDARSRWLRDFASLLAKDR